MDIFINTQNIKKMNIDIMKNILNKVKDKIFNNIENIKIDEFIKNYNLYELYLLYFINHTSINIDELNILINIINTNIIKFIMIQMKYPQIRQIAKNISPYILYNKKITKSSIKTIELIVEQNNILAYKKNFDKFLETIIFRYISSKNNGYSNFHDFYVENYINEYYSTNKNFIHFFNDIFDSSNIINFTVDAKIKEIEKININDINKFIFNKYNIKNNIININDNIIEININPNINIGIVHKKYNLNNIINIDTKNHIIINFNYYEINNLSLLLIYIHYLTISLKLINFIPNNIYELNNSHAIPNYFLDTFINFFKFIKDKINVDLSYNKYIVDLFKFYYMYSFYDYIFFNDNTIIKMMLKNKKESGNILNDMLCELQDMFNFKNTLNYPPFIDNDDNIDNIIYYSFQSLNYFKLFDFIKALMKVFNIDKLYRFDKLFSDCINVKIINNVIKIPKSKPVIGNVEASFIETDVYIDDFILKL